MPGYKCRHCFTRGGPEGAPCAVCGIDPAKDPKALAPDEKKIAYRCRTLYTIGFLAIVSGFFGLFLTLPAIFMGLRGTPGKVGMSAEIVPYYVFGMLGLSSALPAFGLGVRRYRRWSRGMGIALFSLFALLHLVGGNFVFMAASLLFLYYVASPPARRILAF